MDPKTTAERLATVIREARATVESVWTVLSRCPIDPDASCLLRAFGDLLDIVERDENASVRALDRPDGPGVWRVRPNGPPAPFSLVCPPHALVRVRMERGTDSHSQREWLLVGDLTAGNYIPIDAVQALRWIRVEIPSTE